LTTLPYRIYSRFVHGKPTHVVGEDWDNLIILDACRYDTFAEINWLEGDLESRISKGCVTGNFLGKNFTDEYPDMVYLAGNPHASRIIPDRFHAFLPVWQTHWDEELGTVPPEAMTEAVIEAANRFPSKRIVAHYVQPHEPYIGPETQERYGSEYMNGLRIAREMAETDESKQSAKGGIMTRYREGELSRSEALSAYRENLEIALSSVESLHAELSGKTVVSSDHGEMFGEFAWPLPVRRIGHWGGLRTTKLVKVPWFTLPYDERKGITRGTIQQASAESENERTEKLRALGYLQ
jgi:hypothetical protein